MDNLLGEDSDEEDEKVAELTNQLKESNESGEAGGEGKGSGSGGAGDGDKGGKDGDGDGGDDDDDDEMLELSSSDDSDDEDGGGKKIIKKKKLKKGGKKKKKKKQQQKEGASRLVVTEDNFIDDEDDDPDALAGYANQREFDDEEDPYADDERRDELSDDNVIDDIDGPRSKRSTAGLRTTDDKKAEAAKKRKEPEIDPTSFKGILKNLAKSRSQKSRKGDSTEDDVYPEVQAVLVAMKEAALRDNELRAKRKPATQKLKELPNVISFLQRKDTQKSMIQHNALGFLKEWLGPSPVDKALPAQSIRTKIIAILPYIDITVEDLKQSGFGKIVNYLSNHPKEIPENKQILRTLMQKWSREIFRKSEVPDKRVLRADDDSPAMRNRRKKRTGSSNSSSKGALDKLGQKSAGGKPKATRARIPQAVDFDYKVIPSVGGDLKDGPEIHRPSAKRKALERKMLRARKKRKEKGM